MAESPQKIPTDSGKHGVSGEIADGQEEKEDGQLEKHNLRRTIVFQRADEHQQGENAQNSR